MVGIQNPQGTVRVTRDKTSVSVGRESSHQGCVDGEGFTRLWNKVFCRRDDSGKPLSCWRIFLILCPGMVHFTGSALVTTKLFLKVRLGIASSL